jgi:hypothetical protein
MFGHAPIFFSFIMICIQLSYYTTSDVHLNTCALCKKNGKMYFLFNLILLYFFCLKTYFNMCFDNLIQFYA